MTTSAKSQYKTALLDAFLHVVKIAGLPLPVTEYRFDLVRRWRFDYAWPEYMVALEVEGGVWQKNKDGSTGSRHTMGKGFVNDLTKYNEAALQGWTVIRVTPDQLKTIETMQMLKRAIRK